MTVIEVIVFAVNFHIGMHVFGALDAGRVYESTNLLLILQADPFSSTHSALTLDWPYRW
jgi:hypothetical protein